MSFQFTSGRFKAFDDNGTPLAGGRLYTFASGTTTFKAAYTDATLGTACTYVNDGTGALYIALNARGEAQLWLGSGAYTFALKTSSDVTVWTVDGVATPETAGSAAALAADLASTSTGKGAHLVGFDASRTVYAAVSALYAFTVYVDDPTYGAKGDWNGATGTDDTAAIRAAFSHVKTVGGGRVVFTPGKNYRVTGYVGTDAKNSADLIHNCQVIGFGATLTLNANTTSTDTLCLEGNGNEVLGLTVNSTRAIDHNSNLTPQRTPYQYGIVVGGKGHTQSPRSLGALADFVSGVTVRYCKVTNFNTPIQLIRASNVDVSYNVVDQFTDTGILPDDLTTNINIIGNRVTRGGDDCIFARHMSNSPWATAGNYIGGLRIERNWCQYSFGKGAGGGGYSDVSISDNDILDVWAGGVNWEIDSFAHRDTNDNARIQITKNRIVRPGRYWGTGKLKTTNLGNNQDCGIHTFYENSAATPLARHFKISDNTIVNPYGNGIAAHYIVDADIERNKIISGNYDHGAGAVVSQGAALVVDQVAGFALRDNVIDTDLTLTAGQNAFAIDTFSLSANSGRAVIRRNEVMKGITSWSSSAGTVTSWDIDQEFVTYTTDATATNVAAFLMPDLCASFAKIKTLAVQSGGSNRAWYEKTGTHYRNGGGVTLQVAATIVEQESNAAWDASFSVSGNYMLPRVTGVAATNIVWRTMLELRALTN